VRFLPKNRRRFWILFGLLLVLAVATIWYRHWSPKMELSTAHYTIRSTASPEQTRKVAEMVEILNTAYLRVFTNLPPATGRKLQLKLYRDRAEFRRVNPWVGWAEAFYRKPYCNAYYSEDEVNPYHWMLHEATHQLNNEVAHFKLAKWVDEGLATYFSTSMVKDGKPTPGEIDRNTYPIWWLDSSYLTGDINRDIAVNKFIPLKVIVTGRGGPDLNHNVNLHYVHWWSLSHFLFKFDGGKYQNGYFQVIQEGGSLAAFEKYVGPADRIQTEWYAYLRELSTMRSPALTPSH